MDHSRAKEFWGLETPFGCIDRQLFEKFKEFRVRMVWEFNGKSVTLADVMGPEVEWAKDINWDDNRFEY